MEPINILLVDHNEWDIALVTEALEESKIVNHLDLTKKGTIAIDFVGQGPSYQNSRTPDLILQDINLPIINGHELLKEIKDSLDRRHFPVIIVSSSSSKKDVDLTYFHYANCYITKPIELYEFQKTINNIENFGSRIVSFQTDLG